MILAGTLISSCTEAPIGQTPTDSVAPLPLQNVTIEELPGGARISYDFPADESDISYVKGEYLSQGIKKVVRSSVYEDFLIIEGLGSTDPVEVSLYLVDHSENVSAPVSKTFNPKTPPLQSIYETLNMTADWGGVTVEWDNPLSLEIGVTLFATDSLGEFSEIETRFTPMKEGKYAFRGFDSVQRKFGIMITDKWGNTAPVKEWTITPIFEELIDRTKYKQHILPWDNTSTNGGGQNFNKMFDGQKTNTGMNSWHSKENEESSKQGFTNPILFTIDLGNKCILSRFLLWQGRYNQNFLYSHHNPKLFEVWGVAEIPADKPNEYWHEQWKEDWTLLGDFEIIKPSGLPFGTISDTDISVANAGHEFYVPIVPVRYLRFSVKSTWVGNKDNAVTLHELEFYGMTANN
jgi:hypothetical protein